MKRNVHPGHSAGDSVCETAVETTTRESLIGQPGKFFRFPQALVALQEKILPEVHSRWLTESRTNLRIWSAGYGRGEEAYSIAIALCEAQVAASWRIDIIGSDIRSETLAHAERGLYDAQAVADLPPTLVQKYFVRIGNEFLVKPRLRNLVRFSETNLADPAYIGRFDCIFCLDVLPHLPAAQRAVLLQRLHLFLEPGGYLLLAPGEVASSFDVVFRAVASNGYTLFQKPMAKSARAGA